MSEVDKISDNRNPFFSWLIGLQSQLQLDVYNRNRHHFVDSYEFRNLISNSGEQPQPWLQLYQSIIETLNGSTSSLDTITERLEYYLSQYLIIDTNQITPDHHMPTAQELLDLLRPYLAKPLNPIQNNYRRNICILLTLISKRSSAKEDILNEILDFLVNILSDDQTDQWTILFALIYLCDNVELLKQEQFYHEAIFQRINIFSSIQVELSEVIYLEEFDYLQCQIEFCSQWLVEQLSDSKGRKRNNAHKLHLERVKNPELLKLSPDRLSVRCDCAYTKSYQWQSIRANFCLTSGVYYYEVVLLTSGPMRFGWATEDADLNSNDLGWDRHSVAFDAFNRTIWHDTNRFKTKLNDRSKAGDVVGCKVNFAQQKLRFYLNGKKVKLNEKIKLVFHKGLYPAASIASHQQCWFNFGQCEFRYTQR